MKIYLFGAANPESIRMIQAVKSEHPDVEFPGFLDNDPDKKGCIFYGYPILGSVRLVKNLANRKAGFVNLITGSTRTRYETSIEIINEGGALTNFIHPSIDLTLTKLGVGLYLQESVVIQAGVSVGDNTSIHMGALIGHETIIGESVFIAHAVSISGCCRVGEGSFIGTNATILPRICIGKWATIGAGAVVTKDVPDFATVAGNPGRIISCKQPISG